MCFANGEDTVGENDSFDYLKKFGSKTALGGASGFDAAKIFIEASGQEQSLNQFIHNLKGFQGAFGVYNATSKNDFDFPAVIKIVDLEQFRVISR